MQTKQWSSPPVKTVRSYYSLSPFGTFWIVPARAGVSLWLGGERLGNHPSSTAACRAVIAHQTGHPAWDASAFDVPALSAWGQLISLRPTP